MKKLLILILLLGVSVLLFACGEETPEPEKEGLKYTIVFDVNGELTEQECTEGEMPTPPTVDGIIKNNLYYPFSGWDKEISAASENTTYKAVYATEGLTLYKVRWVLDGGLFTTMVPEGHVPVPPSDMELVVDKPHATLTFTGWDKELTAVSADAIYRASYHSEAKTFEVVIMSGDKVLDTQTVAYGFSPEMIDVELEPLDGFNYVHFHDFDEPIKEDKVIRAMNTICDPELLEFAIEHGNFNTQTNFFNGGNAMLYVILEVRHAAKGDPATTEYFAQYVADSLTALTVKGGKFLNFDLGPTWGNTTLTASIALAKETPAIWNKLSSSTVEVLDFIMECFAYIQCFGTDDDNNYGTGPALQGNYHKDWNPNYRLASVPPMLFCAAYFGGASQVNNIILSFNYDRVIEKFLDYGFTAAYTGWTHEAPTLSDGSKGPTARELLMYGGNAYLRARHDPSGRLEYAEGRAAGTGVGVRTYYTYKSYKLDQVEEIVNYLLLHCYSGGAVIDSYGTYPDGSPKAYILDGTSSPYLGLNGMFLEFKSSDGGDANSSGDIRSSCSYNHHNFILVMTMVSALEELGLYDIEDKDNEAVFAKVWVGNNDFIYKYSHGYMSYSLSKGYESHESASGGYYLWKSYWLEGHNNAFTLETIPSGGNTAPEDGSISEDYTSTAFSVNEKSTTENGISYGCGNKDGCSMQTNNGHLVVSQTANSADPLINITKSGGLKEFVGDKTSVTFSFDLALPKNGTAVTADLRLRESSSKQVLVIMQIRSDDNSVRMGGKYLTTLTNEFVKISIKVDFKTGTLTGYVDGKEVATVSFSVPSSGTGSTPLEWLDNLNNYIFNWWIQKNTSGTPRTLWVDNITVVAE